MSDTAICVSNLSKLYHIGMLQQRHDTLRDALAARFRRNPPSNPKSDELWALRDISFEVKRGEVVGVIGRNGAGKSTLLKILSRITEPTQGCAEIHGRVGSLLEVGTGFHPELTGRENIYLNGAILGMRRFEIERQFDEIVAFAEIERFLDTPVKRYSSGMYVRLAFAVAAHLEPEILLVDEVLAVGDAVFQKKCLGKMGEVAKQGRTVLFVSHNMGAIVQLCQKGLLLVDGRLDMESDAHETVAQYLIHDGTRPQELDLTDWKARSGTGGAIFQSASITNSSGQITDRFFIGDALHLRLRIQTNCRLDVVRISVGIQDSWGLPILLAADVDGGFRFSSPAEVEEIEVILHDLRLYPDTYYVTLWMGDASHQTLDEIERCVAFDVLQGGPLVMRPLPRSQAVVYITPTWNRLGE